MADRLWIERMNWSPETIDKLWKKHHVDYEEVEQMIFEDDERVISREYSSKHGYRFKVEGRTRSGRRLVAFINPDSREEGIWFCITAMEEER
jgi:uncharacterized DUF497 family protein